jgi:hypothetical protein
LQRYKEIAQLNHFCATIFHKNEIFIKYLYVCGKSLLPLQLIRKTTINIKKQLCQTKKNSLPSLLRPPLKSGWTR